MWSPSDQYTSLVVLSAHSEAGHSSICIKISSQMHHKQMLTIFPIISQLNQICVTPCKCTVPTSAAHPKPPSPLTLSTPLTQLDPSMLLLLLVSFSFSLLASYVGPLSEFTTAIQSCKLMLHRPIGGVKGQRWKSTHFTDENFSLFSCNWRWENGMWFANLVVQHQLPHCQTDDWKAEGGADVPKTLKIEEFI